MKILLMEDDAVLSDILLDFLQEHYNVDYAYNAQEVYQHLEKSSYDLFLFDINVVGKNGIELLHELREYTNNTPTIFITAYNDTKHLTKAFDAGAHDYIKKPFELEELQVRIENTKKIFHIETLEKIELAPTLFFYPQTHTIEKALQTIPLGAKDSALLHYMIQHKNRVLSNEELIQNIWDFDSMPSDATLRSHIRTIRDIIGKEKITTIRGEGYIYE